MPRALISCLVLATGVGGALTAAESIDVSKVQIHGFASQGYIRTTHNEWLSKTTDGSFEFNEFAINATANPLDGLTVGLQIFARDLGKVGNDEPQIDWAFGRYQLPPLISAVEASVTAGRFKIDHGFYNNYRDFDMTRASVFLPMSVYSQDFRELYLSADGFQLSTSIRAGGVGIFEVSGFFGTQNIDHESGPLHDQFAQPLDALGLNPSFDRLEFQSKGGGSLTWNTPLEGLRLKGSFIYIHEFAADGTLRPAAVNFPVHIEVPNYHHIIAGAEYQWRDLTLASEWFTDYFKSRASSPAFGGTTEWEHWRTRGGYVSAAYRFLPNWEGYVGWSAVNDPYKEINKWRAVSLALRYDVNNHLLVKVQFDRNQGNWPTYGVDNPNGRSEYWNAYSLKTTYDF